MMSVRTLRAIRSFFNLVEADLDRGLRPKIDTRTLSLAASSLISEISPEKSDSGPETTLTDSPIENCARARALGRLAVEQAVDLALVERHRLVRRSDEAGHARRVLDELPGVVGEVHVHEQVAGHGPLLLRLLLPVLHLLHLLGGDDDLTDVVLLAERDASVLKVLLDLVLVTE